MDTMLKSYFSFMKLLQLTVGALALLLLGGCSYYSVNFSLTNDNFKARGKSIAVISGTREQQNVEIASQVTDALRKKSRYQVLAQQQVAQSLPGYPQNIKGPYKSAYFQIDTDWELGDRKRIAEVQRALGVDYLYVIWAPIAISSNGSTVYRVPAVAQLFDQAGTKVVAQTEISLFWGGEASPYFKEGNNEIALQLAEKTGMANGAKK